MRLEVYRARDFLRLGGGLSVLFFLTVGCLVIR